MNFYKEWIQKYQKWKMNLWRWKKNIQHFLRFGNIRMLFSSYILCSVPKSTVFHTGTGVIIGCNVKMGENCVIYQNVTIGSNLKGESSVVLGNNVIIHPYSILTGNIRIGNNVRIGALSFVDKDIPDNITYFNKNCYISNR